MGLRDKIAVLATLDLRTLRDLRGSVRSVSCLQALFAALVTLSASCGNPQDQGSRGATRLSEREVAQHLKLAGFPESVIPTMVCIAKHESRFKTNAINFNTNGSIDHGIFQINDAWWLSECGVDPEGLKDPVVNTRCAKTVFDRQGLMAWYGYQKNWAICNNYKLSESEDKTGEIGFLGPVQPRTFGRVDSAVRRAMASGPRSTCNEKKLRKCLTTGQGYSCFRKYGCKGK